MRNEYEKEIEAARKKEEAVSYGGVSLFHKSSCVILLTHFRITVALGHNQSPSHSYISILAFTLLHTFKFTP